MRESDRGDQDPGSHAGLDHHNLAEYPSIGSQPPGLQWRMKKEGSSEPMMKYQKYLRQKHSVEAAQIHLLRLRTRVDLQPNQYPTARLGQLVKLETQQRHPTARLGEMLLLGHHVNLENHDQRWRKRARPLRARLTGVVLTSSRCFEDSAQLTKLVSAAYCESYTSDGGMQEPPRCSGR